jgi:hypothetical protein
MAIVRNAEGVPGGIPSVWRPSVAISGAVMLVCVAVTTIGTVAADSPMLDITADPMGGFRATAVLHVPASPEVVRAVLTDYEHWPALFNGRFRVVELRREPERVVTDLMIKRSPLPGELRLFCETREFAGGILVTTGLDGDFTRYVRRWTLTPEPNDRKSGPMTGTRAEMELSLELRTWVPDWLLAANLRRELLEHFRLLQENALEKMKVEETR